MAIKSNLICRAVGRSVAGCAIGAAMAATPALAQQASADWSGPYVGIDVGYVAGDDEASEIDGERFYLPKLDGVTGSTHLGWQRQFGRFVGGIEAESGFMDGSAEITENVTGGTVTSGAKVGAFGTLSAKLGIAPTDDWLIFGKVGAGVGKLKGTTVQTCTTADLCDGAQTTEISSAETKDTAWGLILGAGVERRFAPGWSGRLSYQFTGYNKEMALPEVDGPGWEHDVDLHSVRAGVSYRF